MNKRGELSAQLGQDPCQACPPLTTSWCEELSVHQSRGSHRGCFHQVGVYFMQARHLRQGQVLEEEGPHREMTSLASGLCVFETACKGGERPTRHWVMLKKVSILSYSVEALGLYWQMRFKDGDGVNRRIKRKGAFRSVGEVSEAQQCRTHHCSLAVNTIVPSQQSDPLFVQPLVHVCSSCTRAPAQ